MTISYSSLNPLELKTYILIKPIKKLYYAEGYLDRAEAEPRIRRFKERLQGLEAQAQQRRAQAQQRVNLQLVIGRLEEFGAKVMTSLEQLDWAGRRELIRMLVKRVEIGQERVNVVFRVDENPFPPGSDPFKQHCGGREHVAFGKDGPRDPLGFFRNRGNLSGLERHADLPQVKDGDGSKSMQPNTKSY